MAQILVMKMMAQIMVELMESQMVMMAQINSQEEDLVVEAMKMVTMAPIVKIIKTKEKIMDQITTVMRMIIPKMALFR